MSKYDAFIVDPDSGGRLRLKGAVGDAHTFGEPHCFANFDSAQIELIAGKPCDIIFLSARFPREDLIDYIGRARSTTAAKDVSFVLVFGSDEDVNTTISRGIMAGFAGFLVEPYSVATINEMGDLAMQLKNRRIEERERVGYELLIKELIGLVNMRAMFKARGYDAPLVHKALRETAATLKAFSEKALYKYFQCAISMYQDEKHVSSRKIPEVYEGTSKRLQKRNEQDLLDKLRKEIREHAADSERA